MWYEQRNRLKWFRKGRNTNSNLRCGESGMQETERIEIVKDDLNIGQGTLTVT